MADNEIFVPRCKNCAQPIVISNVDSFAERKEWTHDRLGRRAVGEDRRTCLGPPAWWMSHGIAEDNIPHAELWEEGQETAVLDALQRLLASSDLPAPTWAIAAVYKSEEF